jgi:hypothetical protein
MATDSGIDITTGCSPSAIARHDTSPVQGWPGLIGGPPDSAKFGDALVAPSCFRNFGVSRTEGQVPTFGWQEPNRQKLALMATQQELDDLDDLDGSTTLLKQSN